VRAGLTAFLAGVARSVAASNVTINFLLPGTFETERLMASSHEGMAKARLAGGGFYWFYVTQAEPLRR
jgi:NAD(P)-dependent dehydrogenase (short-subunit alcohol dehydrogenase family)